MIRNAKTKNRPPGAGKTQAVHFLCSKMKYDYSIMAKLEGKDKNAFKRTLKNLMSHIGLEIKQDNNKTESYCGILLKDFKDFLTHSSRYNFSYLLFVNDLNVSCDVSRDLTILKDVPQLRLIITSTDSSLASKYVDACHIQLTGMNMDDYMRFFRQTLHFENKEEDTIHNIVKHIGSSPLALNCARTYMADRKLDLKKYLELLLDPETGQEIVSTGKSPFYKHGLLQSQKIPLLRIKKKFDKKHKHQWEILLCIPYLDHDSIWIDLLEACLFHHSEMTSNKSVLCAGTIIWECKKFSLCHTVNVLSPMICNSPPLDCLSFHQATTFVLGLMQGDVEHSLLCLVKVFCFEMDINARVYDILERNLMLVNHARKVLNTIEERKSKSNFKFEHNVWLSYLNCVVGATLLFQGVDIELAHQYLETANLLCLDFVGIDPKFDSPTKENIKQIFDAFESICCEEKFINEFILHKRRSRNDTEFLKRESKNSNIIAYLSQSDYTDLRKKKLAMPLDILKKQFLKELMLHILYNNGRALNEINKLDENKQNKQACYYAFMAYDELTSLMKTKKEHDIFPSLHLLVNERSGRQYMMWNNIDQDISIDHLDAEMSKVRVMLEKTVKTGTESDTMSKGFHFDFGIVKISSTTNKHHFLMCLRVLLKYLEKKFNLSKECNKSEIFEQGLDIIKTFEREMQFEEKNKIESGNLLAMPSFYIQCGMFLYLSKDQKDLEHSIELYKNAIKIEQDRGVFWTRFLREGNVGILRCLKRLKHDKEVKEKYEMIAELLNGTGRNRFLEELDIELNSSQ